MNLDIKPWIIVKIAIFALLLASARASMVSIGIYQELIITLVCFYYMYSKGMYAWSQIQVLAAVLLCLMSVYTMHGNPNITAYGGMFVAVLMPSLLLGLKDNIKIELFDDFSNWLAILLCLSIAGWLLHLYGVPLPHSSTKIEYNDSGSYVIVQNYFLFRSSIHSNSLLDAAFPRFNGFFLEPGHMGTIMSFFLFANGFNMEKKRNIIFLIVIVMTLSAAAYTVLAIGFILYKAASGSTKLAFRALILVALLSLLALFYNNGDNLVNELIFGKLTREQGALDGRVSVETKMLYDRLWDNGDYLFGLGYVNLTQSAGFKVFFVMNGIIGVLLVLLSYFSIYKTEQSKYALYMFILYMINFTQRTYCTWDAFLVPFILGVVYLKKEIYQTKQLTE